MAFRFRTRLTLTISFLVILTVAALTLGTVAIFGYNMWQMGYDRGEALNELAHRNIEYGVSVPERVIQHIDDQMIVQAFLTAELLALAERPGPATPEEISASLKNVIERSEAVAGAPLVNEFRATDDQGRTYIQVNAGDSAYNPDEFDDPASAFMSLLNSGAAPMVGDVKPDNPDLVPMRYAGVPGVDGPRIVQVGASLDLMDGIRRQFDVQNILERFMLRDYFNQLAVIDQEGRVVAALDRDGNRGVEVVSDRVVRAAQTYLRESTFSEPNFIGLSDRNLGVITPLQVIEGEPPYALYVEHRVGDALQLLFSRAMLIVMIGAGMILFGLIVSILLSRSLSKPIVALSNGAREFGRGNLNYRMYLKRKDEFQGLAQAFNTMAISLQEYMHELEQETTRRERLESEFRIASEMQQALLPDNPPQVEGLELVGWSRPSKEVGGDFYDFFEMGDGCIGVALGDATGKGVSAALLITQCSGILRTLAAETGDPGELLFRTNNAFYKRIGQTHRFVTLFLMCIDLKHRVVKYATAGHPSPILTNTVTKETRWLCHESTGYPLGIVENAVFEQMEYPLKAEDTIIVFSDGLTDAQNTFKELFGEERIEVAIRDASDQPVPAILKRLRSEAERHMNGKEPIDDMTLVGIRVHHVSQTVPPLPQAQTSESS